MKKLLTLAFIVFAFTGAVRAQSNVATQQVAINVSEISVISVAGTISMTISSATPGQAPDPVSAEASYSVSTNGDNQKITAELDDDMPDGLTLYATMGAPKGASSEGKVQLGGKAHDLVKSIRRVSGTGLSLQYQAVASIEAKPENVSRTVTYTITKN